MDAASRHVQPRRIIELSLPEQLRVPPGVEQVFAVLRHAPRVAQLAHVRKHLGVRRRVQALAHDPADFRFASRLSCFSVRAEVIPRMGMFFRERDIAPRSLHAHDGARVHCPPRCPMYDRALLDLPVGPSSEAHVDLRSVYG